VRLGQRTFLGVTILQGVFDTVCKMLQIIRDQQGHLHTDVIDCEALLSEMQTAFDNRELNMNMSFVVTPAVQPQPGPSQQPKPGPSQSRKRQSPGSDKGPGGNGRARRRVHISTY